MQTTFVQCLDTLTIVEVPKLDLPVISTSHYSTGSINIIALH